MFVLCHIVNMVGCCCIVARRLIDPTGFSTHSRVEQDGTRSEQNMQIVSMFRVLYSMVVQAEDVSGLLNFKLSSWFIMLK